MEIFDLPRMIHRKGRPFYGISFDFPRIMKKTKIKKSHDTVPLLGGQVTDIDWS
jgi:hypothetical protein